MGFTVVVNSLCQELDEAGRQYSAEAGRCIVVVEFSWQSFV